MIARIQSSGRRGRENFNSRINIEANISDQLGDKNIYLVIIRKNQDGFSADVIKWKEQGHKRLGAWLNGSFFRCHCELVHSYNLSGIKNDGKRRWLFFPHLFYWWFGRKLRSLYGNWSLAYLVLLDFKVRPPIQNTDFLLLISGSNGHTCLHNAF